MSALDTRFTRADYDRLPEGFPAQLVEGILVKEPAPTYGHMCLQNRLHARLLALVGPERAMPAPSDVGIDEWNVYQPDLLVLRTRPSWEVHDVGIPLLAVEVLSPSTARHDRVVKRRRLLAAGVEEVWIVDPVKHTVEAYDAAGVRSVTGAEPLASRALPGFTVVPAELFAPPK